MDNNDQGDGRPAPGIMRRLAIIIGAAIAIGVVCAFLTSTKPDPTSVLWNDAIERIRTGGIATVILAPERMILTAPQKRAATKPTNGRTPGPSASSCLAAIYPGGVLSDAAERQVREAMETAKAGGVAVSFGGSLDRSWNWMTGIVAGLVALIALSVVLQLALHRRGPRMDAGSAGRVVDPDSITVRFKDVAGIDEAKSEVEEIVLWFKHHQRFIRLNAEPPKGVLLAGPPGTGKTMLAKAVAAEAGVAFIAVSGSDFTEMFVGVGASRVRAMFAKARSAAPCVLFIDEIDAVGRARGGSMNTNQEAENTLNAILVEMDGMRRNDRMVVMAATNRPELLDHALVRPGRFDRHVHLGLPDLAGRIAILKTYAPRYSFGGDVDLVEVAKWTTGFSGAGIATLLNEAAWFAARRNHVAIFADDVSSARDRISFGAENRSRAKAMTESDKRVIAVHETGHAIVQMEVRKVAVDKVTIIPRGQSLGAMISKPDRDRHNFLRGELRADICVLLAGYAAEHLWGDDISTGASNDLERASAIARRMVDELGMAEGMLRVNQRNDRFMVHRDSEVDGRVDAILVEELDRAKRTLGTHEPWAKRVVEALLAKETLGGDEITALRDAQVDSASVLVAASTADVPA